MARFLPIFRIPGTNIYMPTMTLILLVLLLITVFAVVAIVVGWLFRSSDKFGR
jgi:hypothetical protein